MSDVHPSREPGREDAEGDADARHASRFPPTRWSLVARAAARAANRRPHLGELVCIYSPALRAHLVYARHFNPDRADDLLQSFLADKVVEQNLLGHADPARGKFRTFLLAALDRFAIDVMRYDSAVRRAPRSRMMSLDEQTDTDAGRRGGLGGGAPSVAAVFDRAWAQEVIAESVRRAQDEFQGAGRLDLWGVFEARVLLPATDGLAPPPHEELARRHGFASAGQAANALGTAKRTFTRHFRTVVSEYARSKAEVDEEIRDLWQIFSTSHA
jgi:hypothetical protein